MYNYINIYKYYLQSISGILYMTRFANDESFTIVAVYEQELRLTSLDQ